MRGSPIRKSSDQRSVDSSPRLIAASYVLHRLLVPRHPPCALTNLTNTQQTHTRPPHPEGRRRPSAGNTQFLQDARVHCAVLKERKMTTHQPPPAPPHGERYDNQAISHQKQRSPVPSGPNSVPTTPRPHPIPFHAPNRRPYWAPGVSRRPNWSAFHPRAPPQTPETLRTESLPGLGVALDHHNQCGGQCSLERR